MAQIAQPKRPYQTPSITSVRVFLPMLAATSGGKPRIKQRIPFQPK
jgi:hypothetical protein